jgi:hypothetical protein
MALQRAAVRATAVNAVPPVVHEVLRSPGRPLAPATRAFMESHFGHDFSRVRVHTGARADESARAVNALAYTVGHHVAFAAGQYRPETAAGRQLLAHELTHVLQQRQTPAGRPTQISSPGDHQERQAEQVAQALGRRPLPGGQVLPQLGARSTPPCLQRLIRTSLVTGCGANNPFGADRRAVFLIETALAKIDSAVAARAANPADPNVVAVGNALRTAFRLNPANNDTWTLPAPDVRLPVIRRRLEIAKDYIKSVVFTINCPAAGGTYTFAAAGCGTVTCSAGIEAWSCHVSPTEMVLCPPFWALSANQRGRTFAHEIFHITFGFINDWGQPDVHNAHCYAQFIALLNGFNSPAGFTCH